MSKIRWRDSYRRPKIWIFDARLPLLWTIPLLHFRVWTVSIALLATGIAYYFEVRSSMNLEAAARMVKSWFLGNRRTATKHGRRWSIDYGRAGRDDRPRDEGDE